jgi:hypothetical protein
MRTALAEAKVLVAGKPKHQPSSNLTKVLEKGRQLFGHLFLRAGDKRRCSSADACFPNRADYIIPRNSCAAAKASLAAETLLHTFNNANATFTSGMPTPQRANHCRRPSLDGWCWLPVGWR